MFDKIKKKLQEVLQGVGQGIENIKGNIQMLATPQTRETWLRGFMPQTPQLISNLQQNISFLSNPQTRDTWLRGATPEPVPNFIDKVFRPLGTGIGEWMARPYTEPLYRQSQQQLLQSQQSLLDTARRVKDQEQKMRLLRLAQETSNLLKTTAPQPSYTPREVALSGLRTFGTAVFPQTVVGGAVMGMIPELLKGAYQKVKGEKPQMRLGEAASEGAVFGATLGPIEAAVSPFLQPLLKKISPVEVKNISQYLKLADRATTPEAKKEFLNLAIKRVVQNVGAGAIKGGVGMGLYGATEEAKTPKERLHNIFEQAKAGAVFGGGIEGLRLGGQAALYKLRGVKPEEIPMGLSVKPVSKEEHFKNLAEQKKVIPKELEPLAQGARKYKSADEAIKSGAEEIILPQKSIVFRGQKKGKKYGQFYTTDKNIAMGYGPQSGYNREVISIDVSNKKFLNERELINKINYEWEDELIQKYPNIFSKIDKEFGIDNEIKPELEKYPYKLADEISSFLDEKGYAGLFSPDNMEIFILKTKLTDFYNQAVKGVKEVPKLKVKAPEKVQFTTQPTSPPLSPTGEAGGGGVGEIKPPQAPEPVPQQLLKERQFFKTAEETKATPEEILKPLRESKSRYYQPLSNPQLLDEASSFIKEKGFDETYKLFRENKLPAEKIIATGELLAQKAFNEGRMDDGFKIIEQLAEKGTELGRGVQSFSIWSRMTPEGMLKYANNLLKKAEEEYKASFTGKLFKGADFKLTTNEKNIIYDAMKKAMASTNELEKKKYIDIAMETISRKVPLQISEFLDTYRYNNMLSGPQTHGRNFYQNFINTYITPATTLIAEGKPKEAIKFEVNVLKNTSRGLDAFIKALLDKTPKDLSKTEILIKEAQYKKVPKMFRVFSDIMEASDVGFRTILESSFIANGKTPEQASALANEYLYRLPLKERGRGILSDNLRAMGEGIEAMGRKFKPIRWAVPFIRTPFNAAIGQVEYSPLGAANLIGAKDKRNVIAKTILGSIATFIGTTLALQDRTTWAPPTDPEEKAYFYASGKKPFSVYIGGKWVPAYYFGPFAFAFLLPTAMKYYYKESQKALTDADWQKIGKAISSIIYYWSQSTPMSGLGGFVRTLQGDIDFSVARNLGYTGQQIILYNSLLRWINNFVDNIYRKPEGFVEQFVSGIPFISTSVVKDYYKEPTGEPATRDLINQFLPYPIGIPKENAEFYDVLLKERQQERQMNNLINQMKKDIEEGKDTTEITGKMEKIGLKAETTPLSSLIERKKLESLYSKADQMFELYLKAPDDKMRSKIEANIKSLGIDFNEGLYNYISKYDTDSKTDYVKEIISGIEDRDKLVDTLSTLRKRGVASNKMILSDGVIDNLYDEDLITDDERRYLKSLEWDKKQKKVYVKSKGKKVKLGETPKLKLPRVSLTGAQVKITLPKPQKIVLKPKASKKTARRINIAEVLRKQIEKAGKITI